MDEDLRKRRLLVIGVEAKKWFEYMLLTFDCKKVDIPDDVASAMFMQGEAMCAFGEYILDPTEDRLWILNSVVMGMGVDFKF